MQQIVGDRGVDIIVDPVFGTYMWENADVLAVDGTIVVLAMMGGAVSYLLPARRKATGYLTGDSLQGKGRNSGRYTAHPYAVHGVVECHHAGAM